MSSGPRILLVCCEASWEHLLLFLMVVEPIEEGPLLLLAVLTLVWLELTAVLPTWVETLELGLLSENLELANLMVL